ncbi:PAS domain-containing protein [Rhizobium sp. Leaf371]|uniref:PAS domain-containing protein n=1 Tax=Rhizobium sp. Leaf371 TaxID=1736355 RepID=UPI000AAFB0B9|nr:PAS domain-containing protein [Rhizobium sp. Leaf371]
MRTLIDLFWMKYSKLYEAVDQGDALLIDGLDREIKPLVKAIENKQARSAEEARLQFDFLLDLLRQEADDRAHVIRHSNTLSRLAERYFVEAETGRFRIRDPGISLTCDSPPPEKAQEPSLDEDVLDSLPDHVFVITTDYRYLYTNALHARAVDSKVLSLVGRPVVERSDQQPFFEDSLKPRLERCFRGEIVDTTYAREVNGRTIVIRSRMTPARCDAGEIIGAIVVYQELANRRRTVAAEAAA